MLDELFQGFLKVKIFKINTHNHVGCRKLDLIF
jgi:hypothetical protein